MLIQFLPILLIFMSFSGSFFHSVTSVLKKGPRVFIQQNEELSNGATYWQNEGEILRAKQLQQSQGRVTEGSIDLT